MTILILNWRDPKNPNAGGAELLTQEMAKRWVKKGHTVIQISSLFTDARKEEVIDGVHFIRMGKWWSVQFLACFYYLRHLKNSTNIIIDEVHWFPFFSTLYAPKKTVLFVCEVANKLFYTVFPYPIAISWRVFERIYLHMYKNVPAMAISKSTYDDLIKERHSSKNLIILPMGLTVPSKLKKYPKEKKPTLISVSRLNRQKGTFDVIEAFSLVKKDVPNARLWLVGSASKDMLEEVKNKMKSYKLTDSVKLFGFVSQEKKFELLSRSHLLVSASTQEGWGLTIQEAALTQTPSVVYNTHGFRDSITNKKDGILTGSNPNALAEGITQVLKNKELHKKLQLHAEKKVKQHSWEKTADVSLRFLRSL
jgi:glycosyltransferase involved in cell wall biosynthesis